MGLPLLRHPLGSDRNTGFAPDPAGNNPKLGVGWLFSADGHNPEHPSMAAQEGLDSFLDELMGVVGTPAPECSESLVSSSLPEERPSWQQLSPQPWPKRLRTLPSAAPLLDGEEDELDDAQGGQ
eukprot:5937629-Lingulodinium_polyedra.AAC.1